MKMKFWLTLALFLVSLGFVGMGTPVSAQAASRTALPSAYRGTWYGYLGTTPHHHVNYYYTCQVGYSAKKVSTVLGITTSSKLTDITPQSEMQEQVTYQRRVNKRGRVSYNVIRKKDNLLMGVLRLATVKVKGVPKIALSWGPDAGDDPVYAFRTPVRRAPWEIYYWCV
jgi:hypothetical protein